MFWNRYQSVGIVVAVSFIVLSAFASAHKESAFVVAHSAAARGYVVITASHRRH